MKRRFGIVFFVAVSIGVGILSWSLAPAGEVKLISMEIEPIHEPASLYKLQLTMSNGTSTRIEVGHRELKFETSEGEIIFQNVGPSVSVKSTTSLR